MILKFYELDKLNFKNNLILFHGKNAGLKDEENFFHWNATIIGPKDTI